MKNFSIALVASLAAFAAATPLGERDSSKAGNRGGDIAKDATNLGNSIAKTSRTGNGGGDIAKEAVNLSGSITNTALSLAGLVRDEGEGHDHDN